jgi:DNA polymerase III subunit epsilon
MREIVLDTETTGFEPETGDRIVEIGAIELVNHLPSGRVYHQYINPERAMPPSAFEVHGLGDEFLRDKPPFRAIAKAFLEFVGDARLVIHNAAFDIKFINAELAWLSLPPIPWERAVDTLAMARGRFPGSPCSLDALCRRFGVDNAARTKHGALLDSELLAEIYLELVGGRQPDFALSVTLTGATESDSAGPWRPRPRPGPLAPGLTQDERAAHAAFVAAMGEDALWNVYADEAAATA